MTRKNWKGKDKVVGLFQAKGRSVKGLRLIVQKPKDNRAGKWRARRRVAQSWLGKRGRAGSRAASWAGAGPGVRAKCDEKL